MPKPYPLTRQSGSILLGVVGLTVVMTLGATSFLMLTANASRATDFMADDRALHYAAESGLMMGVAWIKNYPHTSYDVAWPGMTGATLHYGSSISLNGYIVKVTVEGTTPGFRILKSVATREVGQMEETIIWKFTYPPPTNDAGGSLFLQLDYQESLSAHSL